MLKYLLVCGVCSFGLLGPSYGQLLQLGGGITTEMSWGDTDSHIYYNDIHPNWANWQPGIREGNALAIIRPAKGLSLHSRVQLRRRFGNELNQWVLIQAHARWQSANHRWRIDAGRFISPFGNWYQLALPQDRLFVTAPLWYQYYTNISSTVGYSPDLQEPNALFVLGFRDWGVPHAYGGGYATGLSVRHAFKKDSATLDIALVNGALNVFDDWRLPLRPTVVSRFAWRPAYFWEQGFSLSYGGFVGENALTDTLADLGRYTQLSIGADWRIGYKHLEVAGELIGAWYRVPAFSGGLNTFVSTGDEALWLASLGAYVDIRLDLPFLVGAYIASRTGYIGFGEAPNVSPAISWDDSSWRQTLGIGYEITPFLLFKSFYAFQGVQNKAWKLGQWRNSLTVFY